MDSQIRYLKWRYYKANRRARRLVYSKLYRDDNRDIGKSIMVAGTGRSGTTWLADIIASQASSRIMFEPFHSQKITAFSQFHYFQYMRPEERNEALVSYCRRIFSGDIRDGWIDRQVEQLRPEYRIIKDIRANLFLKWINSHFPEVPLIFIIRHPCAVCHSRMQLDWATDSDIEPFLSQPKLVEDFLADKMDVIRNAKTNEEKHAVIWCVSNLVPLKQFAAGEIDVFFYEDLCLEPGAVIPRLFRIVNLDYQDSIYTNVARPSTTTIQTSAILTGENKVRTWKRYLTSGQVARILDVVGAFELDYLYGEGSTPLNKPSNITI